MEHVRRVWHADRGRLLLRTPGPVPLGYLLTMLCVLIFITSPLGVAVGLLSI